MAGEPPRSRVQEIKTVPYVPLSHPFIERLIGTVRREFLDHALFWNSLDLQRKLETFRTYYNENRVHASLDGDTPAKVSGKSTMKRAKLACFNWEPHCHGLARLPLAARPGIRDAQVITSRRWCGLEDRNRVMTQPMQ